ncbi:MAG: carboxypeptidase-like regulatory domain-containing protein [Prevotellaceae bacterium]|jgi:thiamine biosynthesis lipoprotein ApbE|nr:carboxypeptidase-like regulatory domain-containing protein [Prevotellaceae bacterium]
MKITLLFGFAVLILVSTSCRHEDLEEEKDAILYGVITDHETGEPIANASVVLSPGGKTKTTGTDGSYEFQDLDAAQYTITVQKTGYATNRKTVTAVARGKVEANIPLTKSN